MCRTRLIPRHVTSSFKVYVPRQRHGDEGDCADVQDGAKLCAAALAELGSDGSLCGGRQSFDELDRVRYGPHLEREGGQSKRCGRPYAIWLLRMVVLQYLGRSKKENESALAQTHNVRRRV